VVLTLLDVGHSREGFEIIGIDNPITAWIYEEENHKKNSTLIGISREPNNTKNIICYDEDDYITDNYWRSSIYAGNNIHLQGAHNHENLIAAYAACRALNVEEHLVESHIKSFVGLPHRMQYVGSINKVGFYNDSKATNADAAKPALLALNNIYWLAGGISKDGGIDSILDFMGNVKKAYLFGEAATEFADTLNEKVDFELFENLGAAFNKAYLDALESGEKSNILLSPACASYDQFKNFEERGNSFIQLYKNLSKVVGASS
jgi:UDP-N-acetylmuramoylalanine--D-glutamate ligase